MKANKIRFLAGGLAAVMLMSNITATAVFAEETEEQVAVESSVEETVCFPSPMRPMKPP